MPKITPAGMVAKSALFTYLAPRLAQDSKINYNSLVGKLTAKNFRSQKANLIAAVDRAVNGQLANDADISDLAALLDALTPNVEAANKDLTPDLTPDSPPQMQTAPNGAAPVKGVDDEPTDIVAKIKAYLAEEGVPPEILSNLDAFLANEDKPDPDVGETTPEKLSGDNTDGMGGAIEGLDGELEDKIPDIDPVNKGSVIRSSEGTNAEPGTADDEDDDDEDWLKSMGKDGIMPKQQEGQVITKAAMDAAIKQATTAERNNQRNIRQALAHVRPWVGDLAMDAARPADVFRTTLKALGMDAAKVDKLHPHALIPILEAQPRSQARRQAPTRGSLASDAAPAQSFAERFPMAGKITVQ